ncbi:NAD-dependent succinate-semialdehyde dehydrogenase [Paenarthrobacter sp. NPDC091711]|uniref:NAD-dependent succinate-semialdehyde dehydrogenase n=1 Tax=Paenarthrobacter sp. NPDC091711 TaxID=3364385 RepID=UPI0037FD07E0
MITAERNLYVGGDWTPSSDGLWLHVEDPATATPFDAVADATPKDGIRAAEAAHAAFDSWSATTPRERAEVLRRAFELLTERKTELAHLIVRENGKSLQDALAEVTYAAEFFRWYGEEAVRNYGNFLQAPNNPDRKILTLEQPAGVALLITPWNLPAAMITRKVAPALAAGCTVVVKPSFQTPLTALAIAAILQEAGVPDGVVNVVPTTRDKELVAAVLESGIVRVLSFTGSTEVGRALLQQAGDRVINSSMELGGNAPFIVCQDADLEAAVADALTAKMRHNAEACIAANRIYAHNSIRSEFAERLASALDSLVVGAGSDPATQVGPLISRGFRDRVQSVVDKAVASGARISTGSRPLPDDGYYFSPVVLDGVHANADIVQTELFAPVAPVIGFDDDDQVIAYANSSEMGLGSYVQSRDLGRALRIAEKLEAGMVGINTGLISDPAAPFGGVKQSGIGREGGQHGMHEFTETKFISVSWS